ncbi:MAG: zf-HC2 domain-containing protein [Candidatus Krumholzibacteria bacterium]|jgi:hypothetical protein|nr:zf-HC2 domain-containing protein [Candidatus Krumholzibacteria bacterium]
MNERRPTEHPDYDDLERLGRYHAGELTDEQAAFIREHLADCPACRLELRRLARFLALEQDDELSAEAAWDRAKSALDARVAALWPPSADQSNRAARRTDWTAARNHRLRIVPRSQWWIPVAAAAAMTLVVLGINRADFSATAPEGGAMLPALDAVGPLRGGEKATARFVTLRPIGDIAAKPDTFAWHAEQPWDRFTLEIYTPGLRTVYRREQLATTHFAVPDSLRALLRADSTYLWSVQGFHKLEPVGATPEAWFRILH